MVKSPPLAAERLAPLKFHERKYYENPRSESVGCIGLAGALNLQLSTLNRLRPRHGVHVSRPAPEQRQSGQRHLQPDFSLFNTNTSGVAVAGPVTNNGVIVTNGLFTVLIDFGPGVFTGETNWLEIAWRPTGSAPSPP